MIPLVHNCGQLTVADLFLLSLIADGVDSRSELVKSCEIPERTLYRRLRVLCGDSWIQHGKVRVSQNPALVQMRKHPHQSGMQVLLTDGGEQLLAGINELTQAYQAAQA